MTARFLRVCMRRAIRTHYDEAASAGFRASDRWLQAFARRHGMRLRRKTNAKHLSIEARLAQCKRWHARFRRRLGRARIPLAADPTWGRWLPEDRLSIDQVPCNLREGDGRTYADAGAKRVWLAGSKHDAAPAGHVLVCCALPGPRRVSSKSGGPPFNPQVPWYLVRL